MSAIRQYLPAALPVRRTCFAHGATPGPARARSYLTLDTGNMRHAEAIADHPGKHQVKATFFVAQEKTLRGDTPSTKPGADYWKARVAEGHAFGSHTWRHGSFRQDEADGRVTYRLMDGSHARSMQHKSARN
jgi:peptidoglycan/xylan/chitin deacetylase (PgdA/CDA1 family)